MDNVPTVAPVNEDLAAKIKAEFGEMVKEAEASGELLSEQPAPKRGRGRPPLPRDEDGKVIRDGSKPTYTASILRSTPAPTLSKRETKEVAERLANILTGATGVISVAKPYLQMTDDEAKAISEPLSTYLIRMEPTSKVARRILDEYDLVAVLFAILAYGVRVYFNYQTERDAIKNVTPKEQGLEPIATKRRSEPKVPDVSRSGNGAIEDDRGPTRYAGPISTPVIEGNGVLPGF